MENKIAIFYAINFFKPPADLYSDIDDDIDIIINTILSKSSVRVPKLEGYVENIIPLFSSEQFKSHFRVTPSTFEFILNEIGEKLHRVTGGREVISAEKQLLITLWRYATPDSYRSIIQKFNVGKGTAIRIVRRVTKALCDISERCIVWLKRNIIQDIVLGFSRTKSFPGVIRATDGTHIVIPAPKENSEAYINRKGRHSIQLQVMF
ncbi:hypothetical protein DMN91_005665 [Ooceraea biroi]|uniref:Nuclease HARBI1 n=1 Tax=Ooceraea biroi TaxID=2015173 RepID=A0A3L8DM90_OOCBI|nr:hypothetical protein DMN91_005665 [Ooceraea biroi]